MIDAKTISSQEMNWKMFYDYTKALGIFQHPDAEYLMEERLGIICKNPRCPTSDELAITLEQLIEHANRLNQ